MRSAERRPRSCPAGRQVSSRPERPTSPSCPLVLSAPVQAPGARERRQVCASQLGSGSRVPPSSPPASAGLGLRSRGSGRRAHPAPTLQGPAPASSRELSSKLRAGGNGGTFWHRSLLPVGSPLLGDTRPRGSVHLPMLNLQLSSVPSSPEVWHLRARGDSGLLRIASRPRRGARGRAPLLLGTLLLPGLQLCKEAHCAPVVMEGRLHLFTTHVRWNWVGCESAGSQNLGKLCLPLGRGSEAPGESLRWAPGARFAAIRN